jgi:hypothetical protein
MAAPSHDDYYFGKKFPMKPY